MTQTAGLRNLALTVTQLQLTLLVHMERPQVEAAVRELREIAAEDHSDAAREMMLQCAGEWEDFIRRTWPIEESA